MEDKQKVYDVLDSHRLGVISTVSDDGNPEAAIIGFGQTKDFELIFGTDKNSRKYANIQHNPRIAMAVGGDSSVTVQYEGVAEEVSGDIAQSYKDVYFIKTPSAQKFDQDPNNRYFKIRPLWIRYTDLSKKPWEVFELRF